MVAQISTRSTAVATAGARSRGSRALGFGRGGAPRAAGGNRMVSEDEGRLARRQFLAGDASASKASPSKYSMYKVQIGLKSGQKREERKSNNSMYPFEVTSAWIGGTMVAKARGGGAQKMGGFSRSTFFGHTR